MTITSANATSSAISGQCTTPFAPGFVSQSSTVALNMTTDGGAGTCTFINTGKRKDKYTINIYYTFEGSTFAKTLTGDLLSKREN